MRDNVHALNCLKSHCPALFHTFSVFDYCMTTKQALAIVVDVRRHAILLLDHDHAYIAYIHVCSQLASTHTFVIKSSGDGLKDSW